VEGVRRFELRWTPARGQESSKPYRCPPPRARGMAAGSEARSFLRLIDFVYHSTLALRVIKKKRRID